MKFIFLFCAVIAGAVALPSPPLVFREVSPSAAEACSNEACYLPDCYCSSNSIPGGISRDQTPQFVLLTFDDAITVSNMGYYNDALMGRSNPDTCPLSATFFVSHEYTNYSMVNELYNRGHEIALHSITHQAMTSYWKDATVETMTREFADQKIMMEKFANIPQDSVKGMRIPFLQLAGNNQFEMLSNNDFLYDLSWASRSQMWPYTLKYASSQECTIGPCPTESFPNIWVIPMVFWTNDNGNQTCAMADACVNYDDGDLTEWMIREFRKHYDGNRAPFGVYIHAAWFLADETGERFEAYKRFLNFLSGLNDVFVSSGSRVIDWVKNPRSVEQMRDPDNINCRFPESRSCQSKACSLLNSDGNERWMHNCAPECPEEYPWLNNPLGNVINP